MAHHQQSKGPLNSIVVEVHFPIAKKKQKTKKQLPFLNALSNLIKILKPDFQILFWRVKKKKKQAEL